jgi:hypothetical protein
LAFYGKNHQTIYFELVQTTPTNKRGIEKKESFGTLECFRKKRKNHVFVVFNLQKLKTYGCIIKIFYRTHPNVRHSSINVSLTYLRGLEVPELTEEDMPEL